ncbi:MAG: hypothetical protein C0614_12665 [Desulfuromonas sp.]|nr:MAG: hypothetical protein C0614_12665 [Desulfuromonas sp.]
MRTLIFPILIGFLLCAAPVLAHHPAADIVDEEIYSFLDEMVSDTPHATLDFDDMGNMIVVEITTDFVSTAEALIQQGLLSHASLLDGDVTMTIEFEEQPEESIFYPLPNGKSDNASKNHSKWSEWGGKVIITIVQEFE